MVCENSNVRLYFSWFEKRFKLHDKIFGMIPGNIFIIETCRIHFTLCPMKIVMQVLCFKSIKQVLFIHLYLLYIVVCENSSMFFVFQWKLVLAAILPVVSLESDLKLYALLFVIMVVHFYD